MTSRADLADWLRYLEGLHPRAIDLGLERVGAVADALELRPPRCSTLTVAGTNGKGSVVAVTAAGLRAAGHSVGVYTSPHLIDFNERIVIDDKPVPDEALLAAFEEIERSRGDISLSYFEFATLAALWLFRRASVDWQVLEVGLGGRLDAVNILDPDIAVITSIGLDHTEWLGPTREAIAPEKAGIARRGKPVVVLETDPPDSLAESLESMGADIKWRGRDWTMSAEQVHLCDGGQVALPDIDGLLSDNIGGALQALSLAGVVIDAPMLDELASVRVPGRRQRRHWKGHEVLLDVAHNLESVEAMVASLESLPGGERTLALFAAMADKPIHAMLNACAGCFDRWFLPDLAEQPRAMKPADIAALMPEVISTCFDDFDDAWSAVTAALVPGDRLIVFGSFITVGAALARLD
ncbi:folylpolyglutamate synthase [Luminiphilus syltensis NOR5-1B]|uniref:Dihydrofolate synthase/folylpolyglutamate synthase n=1 Tax=Luminiphilus syltensis NOR5-1B TaxID=565045 RepID=B8KYD9_9GAMM|nr:folylpolyglutamate synthase/dihydrofolate synthase family protein [Luminiphilus syltensis]EED36442.1 folylpolyglutamate synthase [Luminiphilus syltensis NOR5-1B]